MSFGIEKEPLMIVNAIFVNASYLLATTPSAPRSEQVNVLCMFSSPSPFILLTLFIFESNDCMKFYSLCFLLVTMSGLEGDWKDTGLVFNYITPLTPLTPVPQPIPEPAPEPDFFHKNILPFSVVVAFTTVLLLTFIAYYFYRSRGNLISEIASLYTT